MAKRSDSESQRREAQLRATLYSIGDAVIATDRSGSVEMMNPVAERLTGWSEAEAVGKPLDTIFHIINEETRQPVENPVARVLREGVVVGLANHTLLIARDGREYAIADAGSPIFDADGKITGVVLVFRDQTAERAAQRALQEARRFAESIVETLREPLLVLDEKLEVVSANRSFYRLFRVRPEETIGKKVYELGNGQWNIARLRALLEDILPSNTHFDDFEVEHTFEHIGKRKMVLNARRLLRSEGTAEFILLAIEDVTERAQAERALQESEERHRHISEIISDYAYSFRVLEDGTLRGEWVTDSFRHTFGYTLQEVQNMGGWQKMVHPDDLPAALEHVRKLLQGERDICEMRFVTRTGESRWLRDYAIPVRDESRGRIVRIYGASQDVTEQRRTQTALRMSEERHRYISELISDYAYALRVEPNNRLVREWVTDSFTHITGYTPLEVDQRGGWQSLVFPDDLPVAQEFIERVLAGQKVVREFRIVRKDGEVRWLRDHATPLLDPLLQRVVRIYGAAQDITERKRAEEALQLSHKRYEQLVNSIDGIVWEADAETFHFHFVSKQAERLLGYPVEEWISQPTFWKDHIHPEDVTWAIEYCT
ncbi:MAG TPA: PAS domain S-box protein, partial [Bacteroidota bacterium]|nr:PAS domain S-box protein [Bacteroidota bacterium]